MRLFQSIFRITRPMTLGVRAWVDRADGTVALVRHTYTPGWYFPGGGVERAEPAMEALRRELLEEVGVELTGAAVLKGVHSNHRAFRNDHVLFYRVPAEAWVSATATSQGEIDEIRWVDPASPPEGTTPGTLRRLQEAVSGDPPSDYW